MQREHSGRRSPKVMEEQGMEVDYKFGTMIEFPGRPSPPTRSPNTPNSSPSAPTT
jgi:hypothetical protein